MTGTRYGTRLGLLCLVLVAAAVLSLGFGTVNLGLRQMLDHALNGANDPVAIILWEIRAPRIILAVLVGASLAVSGAALQGLLRNPLADPGVVGVSASAGLGAVIAIYFGFASLHPLSVPAMAMGGALLSTLVLFVVASRDTSVLTLILVGVALSSLAVSATALVMNFAPNPFNLQDMVMWLMGSLANRSMTDIWLAAPFILVGLGLLFSCGRDLDALTLGEDAAASLGVSLKGLRVRVILGTALAVGASVSICGAVGFVGLVIPHIMRGLFGFSPARILAPSAIGGAILLLFADALTRTPYGGTELRLGVVTAFVGAPVFLYIILKTRGAMR